MNGELPETNSVVPNPLECAVFETATDPLFASIEAGQLIDTLDELNRAVEDVVACNDGSNAVYANNQGLRVWGGSVRC